MRRNTVITILILMCLAGLLGYNYIFEPFAATQSDSAASQISELPSTPEPLSIEEQAAQLVASMSARQKVEQMVAVPLEITNSAPGQSQQGSTFSGTPGFATIFGSQLNASSAAAQIQDWQSRHQLMINDTTIPLAIAVDHEGGTVQRLSGTGFTELPAFSEWCQLPAEERTGFSASAAAELSGVGVDIVLGPVVDVAENNQILNSRICDDTADLVALRAEELAAAYFDAGVLPVLKHFPGIGSTSVDLHDSFQVIDAPTSEISVYSQVVPTFPQIGVMVSHVGVAPYENPIPCSLSEVCVGQLRNQFSEVLVITDDLLMDAVFEGTPFLQEVAVEDRAAAAAVTAAAAGNQVLLFGTDLSSVEYDRVVESLFQQYQQDADFVEQIDAAVTGIMKYKLEMISD